LSGLISIVGSAAVVSYKPFPCGVVIHPILDGCLRIKRAHNIATGDIDKIDLKEHPLVLELTGKQDPKTDLEGRFSVYHSAAAALVRGRAGVDEYTDEAVNDPKIKGLRERVVAVIKGGIAADQADVTITLKDGSTLHIFVDHAIGSKDNPMSDAATRRLEISAIPSWEPRL
jgi:2-methylcitrate dehydratase PrpD